MINVKNKACIVINCNSQPSFSYKNHKPALYCAKHKFDNMVNVRHTLCIFEDCAKKSNYNYNLH